jgi:hypothetical protein
MKQANMAIDLENEKRKNFQTKKRLQSYATQVATLGLFKKIIALFKANNQKKNYLLIFNIIIIIFFFRVIIIIDIKSFIITIIFIQIEIAVVDAYASLADLEK